MNSRRAVVVPLRELADGEPAGSGRREWEPGAAVVLVVAAVATVFLDGLYDLGRWEPVALALLPAALAAVIVGRYPVGPAALLACGGLTALLVWSALSMTWADSVDRAWIEVNRLLLYLAVLVVGLAVMRSRAARGAAVHAMGASIGVVALLTAIEVAAGDAGAFIANRLDAPVDYVNGTAGLFLMGIWPLMAAAERARSPMAAGLALAGVALEGSLLVLTQSRAILPALLVSGLAMLCLVDGRARRVWALAVASAAVAAALPWTLDVFAQRPLTRPAPADGDLLTGAGVAALASSLVAGLVWATVRSAGARVRSQDVQRAGSRGAAALVGGALVAGLVLLGNPMTAVEDQWDRFSANRIDRTTTLRFTDASGLRHDLWRVALEQFAEEPLGGVGAGSYGLRFFQMREIDEAVRQPHSIELQMLAELGLPGGVALLVFMAGVVTALIRRRGDAVLALGAGGVAVVWLVHTSVDWLWNLPGLTAIALIGSAVLLADGKRGATQVAQRLRPVLVGAAILTAVGAASLGRQYAADRSRADAVAAVAEQDFAEALRSSRRALQLNPASMEAHYARAAAFAGYGDYARARATLLRAVGRERLNFVPWGLLGDLAVRRGELATASRSYGNASRLNPRDLQLRRLVSHPRAAVP